MATRKTPAPGSRGATDTSTDVEGLVQSIRTHKKFKRLAGYSIQCLIKVIAPPASDWVALSQEAQRFGVVEAIGEVLQAPTTSDGGIFLQSITAVSAVACSSGAGAVAVAESAALASLLNAFVFFWDSTLPEAARASRGDLEGEDRSTAQGVMKHMSDLLHAVGRQAPGVILSQPAGLSTLLRLAVPTHAGSLVTDLPASAVAMQCLGLVRRARCTLQTSMCSHVCASLPASHA
jgi:hypothetical protein